MIPLSKFRLRIRLPLSGALKRRMRDDRGQSMAETAVSLTLSLLLIFGFIEFCWGLYSFHYLANASHQATRYAIVRGGSWTTNCTDYTDSQCTASTAEIANYVAATAANIPGMYQGPSGTGLTASDVCVLYFASVQSSVTPCTSSSTGTLDNAPGDIVQVTINYPFELNLPFWTPITWQLTSTSQMVIAQ